MKLLKSFTLVISLTAFLFFAGCRDGGVDPHDSETPLPTFKRVSVTSPAKDENWRPGTTHTIKWKFDKEVDKVDLLLFRKGEHKLNIATEITDKGEFLWKVPFELPRSIHYRILVQESGQERNNNFSDYFWVKSDNAVIGDSVSVKKQ